jgi:signal-transduction protein with cAMP-binding, CBS, and nucleotidyltransferase domain
LRITAGEVLEGLEEVDFSVTPDTTIHDALQQMLKRQKGAVLIMEENEVKGIWTERDLMGDTVSETFNPGSAKVGDHMSTDLHYASWNDSIMALMDKYLGLRIRHLLIEKDGKFAGLLSAADVVRAALTERTKQLEELNTMVSWEFYEDWRWRKKKGGK